MASLALQQLSAINAEIALLMDRARRTRLAVKLNVEADRLRYWYPKSGLTRGEIESIIVAMAGVAAVVLELGAREDARCVLPPRDSMSVSARVAH